MTSRRDGAADRPPDGSQPPGRVDAAPGGEPAPREPAGPSPLRVLRSALRPRLRRVDLAVAVLLGLLGFATVVQVRSTQEDGLLASARQEDLVRILDDLANRSDRLRSEVAALSATEQQLTSGSDSSRAALDEARRRTQTLGVLAGTVPATGPGVVLTVSDPALTVHADVLLDALEELRDAGAEAVQVTGRSRQGTPASVRVVADTALVDAPGGGVEVGGTGLRPPYRWLVIGEPGTLSSALAIPGGVLDTVRQSGGAAHVERSTAVDVTALQVLDPPRYARPVPPQPAPR